jgi:hypothetical protein
MENNDERLGLRLDLAAQRDDQDVLAYVAFLGGTLPLVEPLVTQGLPVALGGDDSDREAWAVKAGPILEAVHETVESQDAPDAGTTLLKRRYSSALSSYVLLCDEWIHQAGALTELAQHHLLAGTAAWQKAADQVGAMRDQIGRARPA